MTNKDLLKVIEEAKASEATAFDLSHKGLTTLPPEVGQLTSLTHLNLGDNQLSELPPEIGQLTKLERLDLWNNKLTTLPIEIGQLQNLRELNLSGNKLHTFPPEIRQSTNLTCLCLSWNQLTELPPAICQLTKLKELDLWGNQVAKLPQNIGQLTALRTLNIGHNQLSRLPPELFQLIGLTELNLSRNKLDTLPPELFLMTKLIRLDLNDNKLTALPPEIGQLTCLKRLHLWDNQLSSLPSEIGQLKNLTELPLNYNRLISLPTTIGQLTNLTVLDLGRNLIAALPPEIRQLTKLRTLTLYKNKLTALPIEICQLTNLTTLYLNGNKLADPPFEIARKGIEAIREYFNTLKKDMRPLHEVKLLLIGDGAVGKTSLVKQVLGLPYDPEEGTTHGISLRVWNASTDGKQIKVNFWDFGGQEIMHATHQFFLSKRSLYILVLDGRKDDRSEHWLRYIEAFGGDSPVLIVLNKIDNNPSFDVNRPFLREKYPSIRGFFPTSCKTGKGISWFKEALLEALNKVGMIGTVWPGSWFRVKGRLEQMDRPYISAAEYDGFCQEAGITEAQSRETLVDFLHDLGVAVHFKEFNLDVMHVLNPVWVTNAVYGIITAEKTADSKGVLCLKHLREILPNDHRNKFSYPLETHPYILHLMQKFELCYELDNESVLIPQLLPVVEPEFNFDYSGSLRFALYYPNFLPPSVFPRFMVKVYKDIKPDLHWRTGVVLKDVRSGTDALVKADIEARRINILVSGDHSREYLHYIRYLFADINSSFEKLKIRELVPMPDDEEITADYATLLEYAKNDIDKYIPTDSRKMYKVHELLGLVQIRDTDELARLAEKIIPKGNVSWTEFITELVEPKWTVPIIGITLNLKGFFEKLLARQKQKRQQSRN